MKTRFPKVWCESCKTMQFVGECPHGVGRAIEPDPRAIQNALATEGRRIVEAHQRKLELRAGIRVAGVVIHYARIA